MAFKMTDTSRTIRVYNHSSDTGEFIGVADVFIPERTGLPAYCTDKAPPKTVEGFVSVFDAINNKRSVVEDHRDGTATSDAKWSATNPLDVKKAPHEGCLFCRCGQCVDIDRNKSIYFNMLSKKN